MISLNRSLRFLPSALLCSLFLSILFSSTSPLRAQIKLHEPAEILKIIEESSISYGIDINEETEAVEHTPKQLLPGFFVNRTGDEPTFGSYELSDKAAAFLSKAEELFGEKNYGGAIEQYRKAFAVEPEYSGALTMIGDSYFNMEQYDSARHYLRMAIELNFIDYQAHWFLSSAEFKLGNKKEGLHELTVAHVLNPGHTLLEAALKAARKKYGKEWKEWSFAPRYELVDESLEEVQVRCGPGWMMYALTHAVWQYEENYAKDMGIKDPEGLSTLALKEKEATLMFIFEYLARQESPDEEEEMSTEEVDAVAEQLVEIMKEGMLDPFIYYEILGRENPILFSMMSPKSVDNIVEYLDKYH